METEQMKNERKIMRETLDTMLAASPLICQGIKAAAETACNQDVYKNLRQTAEDYAAHLINLQSALWLKFLTDAGRGWEVEEEACKIRAAINFADLDFTRRRLARTLPDRQKPEKWAV